jgi:hypothetical protein
VEWAVGVDISRFRHTPNEHSLRDPKLIIRDTGGTEGVGLDIIYVRLMYSHVFLGGGGLSEQRDDLHGGHLCLQKIRVRRRRIQARVRRD